jgi:hypothetical protein
LPGSSLPTRTRPAVVSLAADDGRVLAFRPIADYPIVPRAVPHPPYPLPELRDGRLATLCALDPRSPAFAQLCAALDEARAAFEAAPPRHAGTIGRTKETARDAWLVAIAEAFQAATFQAATPETNKHVYHEALLDFVSCVVASYDIGRARSPERIERLLNVEGRRHLLQPRPR